MGAVVRIILYILQEQDVSAQKAKGRDSAVLFSDRGSDVLAEMPAQVIDNAQGRVWLNSHKRVIVTL
jgi:hypothetical protein